MRQALLAAWSCPWALRHGGLAMTRSDLKSSMGQFTAPPGPATTPARCSQSIKRPAAQADTLIAKPNLARIGRPSGDR